VVCQLSFVKTQIETKITIFFEVTDFFVEILTPGMMNASQLYPVCKKALFSLLKTGIRPLRKILQDFFLRTNDSYHTKAASNFFPLNGILF
jgi:hypothetical protein